MLKYTIGLAPITKKNSQQIIKLHGHPAIIPSKKYKEYEASAGWFLTRKPSAPIATPVNIKCVYYMPTKRRVDLNNLLEATTDVLVKHGILEDDHCRIVAGHDGSRVYYDKENPRTEIYIEEMGE